jgi:hypothetical protein
MEFRPRRSGDAMGRPENLFQAIESEELAGLVARVIGRETGVIRGVPILSENGKRKMRTEAVELGDHLIAVGNRQRSAGAKIVLDIDR